MLEGVQGWKTSHACQEWLLDTATGGANVPGAGEESLIGGDSSPEPLRALWPRVPVSLCICFSQSSGKGPLCGLLLGAGLEALETLSISSFPTSAKITCFRFSEGG